MSTIPPPPQPLDPPPVGKPEPHPPPDSDAAWTARKAAYRDTVPYGCRRCLRAGLRGDPDQWLDCHHVWGNGRIWETGNEPDHALMWLCQTHHDAITQGHARLCRKLGAMHGWMITRPMVYSLTLGVWTWCYVLSGRAMLTSGARVALYVVGVLLAVQVGMAALLAVPVWAGVRLWRKAT